MQRSVAAVIGDNISAVCAETAAVVVVVNSTTVVFWTVVTSSRTTVISSRTAAFILGQLLNTVTDHHQDTEHENSVYEGGQRVLPCHFLQHGFGNKHKL